MISALASSPWVQVFALTLLHFLWQGALITLVLALLLWLLGQGAVRARYLVSCGALVLAAAMPVFTAASLWPESTHPLPPSNPLTVAGPLPWQAYGALGIVVLWLFGATLRLVMVGSGLREVKRLVSRCEPLREEVAQRALQIALRMGLTRLPRLLEGTHFDVPMAVGWLKPAVLVPISAITALPPSQLDALIAHELGHVIRHDFLVNVLQEAVISILFFHPGVHFIARTIREAREHVADDLAATAVPAKTLGQALFALESYRTNLPELSVRSHGGDLMNRIQRLLKPSQRPQRPAFLGFVVAGSLFLSALTGLGSCGGTSEATPQVALAEAQNEVQIQWLPPVLAPYKSLFEGAAKKHGVDANVLAIITLLESSGDPAALSPSGAVGLMQIMPATGARIAEERGVLGFDKDRLYDPSVNVDFGAWYWAQQATLFAKDKERSAQVALVSAAYNAGPKAVRAYLAKQGELPEETRRYQSMVVALYEERALDRSPTFDAWRERVRAKVVKGAVSPVSGAKVTASFGGKAEHEGVDLAAKAGTSVAAPLDGEVVSTDKDQKRGQVIVLRHKSGVETRFHHLDAVSVRVGDRVTRGDVIGTVGTSGVVTGPHVHFELRDLGSPVDPSVYVAP